MSFRPIQSFLVRPTASITDAFARIDDNAGGIVLWVNEDGCLVATVTDGDLRRALLAGLSLETTIEEVVRHRDAPGARGPITMPAVTGSAGLMSRMTRDAVAQIPLVDDDNRVVDIVLLRDLVAVRESTGAQAVVMAGGYGTRLRPMTLDIPKPMLPIGGKPLLERTIGSLRDAGLANVSITTHYLPEKIAEHFGDGSEHGVNLSYVHEDEPRGTAGALRLLDELDGPLLVINGDVLTNISFDAMFCFHAEHHADLTVGIREFGMVVPYGVVEADGVLVQGVVEKPRKSYFINAGIYILQPDVVEKIPEDQRYDMTDLIQHVIADGGRVAGFPIYEYWLDIGRREDYERAQEDVREGRFP